MARIFSVPKQFSISLPDVAIVRDDEDYISFELPGGFNWQHHAAYQCADCKAFQDSFGKQTYQWLLFVDNQYHLLDLSHFANESEHFANLSSFQISDTFFGTKLKFKRKEADETLLSAIQILHEAEENYERCMELENVLGYLKTPEEK